MILIEHIYFEYSMTEFSWQPKGNGIFKEGMISLSKTSYIPKQITNITHTAPDPHPTDPESDCEGKPGSDG